MSFLQTHAGINITSEKLQLVELIYSKDGIWLENIDEEYFEEYLDFSAKETKFNSIMQKAFDDLIIRKPLSNNVVSFSLPYNIFKHAELPFDNSLIESDLLNQFKWELSVLFPDRSSDEFLMQYIEIDDEETDKKNKALIFALLKKQVKTIHKFCVRNNLKLKYVDYAHIAANNLIRTLALSKNDETNLSVYIGDKFTSILLSKKNSPLALAVKPIANAGEIMPTINLFNTKIRRLDLNLKSVGQFFIAGDNISDELVSKLNDALEVNFLKINPFIDFGIKQEFVDNKFITHDFNSFSSAAGMALRIV